MYVSVQEQQWQELAYHWKEGGEDVAMAPVAACLIDNICPDGSSFNEGMSIPMRWR